MTDPRLCTEIPDVDTVMDVLGVIPRASTATIVHLLTPSDVMVGPDVWDDNGVWQWRGSTLSLDEVASVRDVAVAVRAWVSALTRPGDVWPALDPADPGSWVKSRRSGTRRLFFGMSLLCAPYLACDAGVPAALAHHVAGLLVVDAIAAPAVVTVDGVSCILDGDGPAKKLLLAGIAPLDESEPW